jgi:2'-5' RNA ligase
VKRVFFAIPVPEDQKEKLLIPFTGKQNFGIRWVAKKELHATTHFVGSLSDNDLDSLLKQATITCASASAFELVFDSFRCLNKNGKPILLWAQFVDNPAFSALSYALRNAFPGEETRKPLPHITLARIKQLKALPFDLPVISKFSFQVNHVELWESHLQASGSVYEKLHSWKLMG